MNQRGREDLAFQQMHTSCDHGREEGQSEKKKKPSIHNEHLDAQNYVSANIQCGFS